jgi:hypothetical protein
VSISGDHIDRLSYVYPEVRATIINILVDASSYDYVDGVTLDFCRYPYVFSNYEQELIDAYVNAGGRMKGTTGNDSKTPENTAQFNAFKAGIMTQFMRDVRSALPGKEITVRIPKSGSYEFALDIQAWINEDLVDVVVPSVLGHEDLLDDKVILNMVLAARSEGSDIQIYGGIESVTGGSDDLTKAEEEAIKRGETVIRSRSTVSLQQYRLRSWEMYRDGYDGIYIHNNWKGKDSLGYLGDKVKIEKWHQFAYPADWVRNLVTVLNPAVNPPVIDEPDPDPESALPEAKNLRIITAAADTRVNGTVAAAYEYYHEKGESENGTVIRWFTADDASGNGTQLITGATARIIVPTPDMLGKYLMVEVTPCTAASQGSVVTAVSNGPVLGEYIPDNPEPEPTPMPVPTPVPTPAPTPTPAPERSEYKDTQSHWAKDDIAYINSLGLVFGTGDGKFSPNVIMDRGMIATVLGRLAKVDASDYTNASRFKDVAVNTYYAPFVEWAATLGIIKGGGNGKYEPEAPLKKEQLAVILMNYAKFMNLKLNASSENNIRFVDDGKISPWAYESIEWAKNLGIIVGSTNGSCEPQKSITRAEAVSMLVRFIRCIAE